MKKKNINHGFRYVAYDAANGEHEEFKTIKEAEDWLKDGDGEGISEEAENGQNWIAEIQYISEVTEIDNKSNYHENEDGVLDVITYKPLFGHTTGRQSKTMWMAFMKTTIPHY